MIKIGIAGGLGSGKSMVAKILGTMGGAIFNADDVAQKIMLSNAEVIQQIKRVFGEDAYMPDGSLNKQYLRNKIFSDTQSLHAINSIVHPYVFEAFKDFCNDYDGFAPFIVAESGIMFKSGFNRFMDVIIGVIAPENLRIVRVKRRSGLPDTIITRIMSYQNSDEFIKKHSDYVIINDGRHPLLPQINSILSAIKKRYEEGVGEHSTAN